MDKKNEVIDIEQIKRSLFTLGLTENTILNKINKGKLNHIFRAIDKQSNKSVIVKSAGAVPANIKTPLNTKIFLPKSRNFKEATVINYIWKNHNSFVPQIYLVNKEKNFFIMEDLIKFEDVRDLVLKGIIPKDFSNKILNMLFCIYDDYKVNPLMINNDLKQILINLLFEIPYSSKMILSNEAILDKNYFIKYLNDKFEIISENLNKLKMIMFEKKQTLLHADLHLGSIFCQYNNYKLYDFEFSFEGALGYDIGKIQAHLILAWFYLKFNNVKNISSLEHELIIYIDKIFDEAVKRSIKDLTYESHMFCGLELISRITGFLQLKYILGISNLSLRTKIQKCIFDIAVKFMTNKEFIKDGKDFIQKLNKLNFKNYE